MLSLQIIKSVLAAAAGISKLSVKFEPENRQIRAIFYQYGRHTEEVISFEQIESLFTDTQEGAQDAPQQPNAGQRVSSTR